MGAQVVRSVMVSQAFVKSRLAARDTKTVSTPGSVLTPYVRIHALSADVQGSKSAAQLGYALNRTDVSRTTPASMTDSALMDPA